MSTDETPTFAAQDGECGAVGTSEPSDTTTPQDGRIGRSDYWPACWPPPNSRAKPGEVDVLLEPDGEVTVQTFVPFAGLPNGDLEVVAVRTIVAALSPLDEAARRRVLEWAHARYLVEEPALGLTDTE